ncbi:MAG: hypothetical protein EYC69_04440 [Bacteroidetes bacterium]|nr:MAG: hypothetical protein EYC69_04440 [Bacteroidota bacterium]
MEHRKQKLVPLRHFFLRMFRYGLFALALISVSLGIGIIGYHHYAQLNFLDSFHMSSMILTGMGPVTEMKSEEAKIFSSFYALYSGVAFLSITAVFLAPVVHRILHILQVEPDNKQD